MEELPAIVRKKKTKRRLLRRGEALLEMRRGEENLNSRVAGEEKIIKAV